MNCFSKYIPTNITPKNLNDETLDPIIDEKFENKDFEKSHTEIETFESIEQLRYSQDVVSDQPIVIILDDSNEKEINDL